MAKLTKGQQRTLKGNNPRLRFNLKDIFGVSLKGKESLRQALADALLERILDKTESGKSVSGKKFRKYSKAYAASDDFKAAGKSRNKVNLRLSSDMMGLLGIVDEGDNTVTFGWEDSDEAAKAHGHIVGARSLPKRDFLGLNKKDIKSVQSQFSSDLDEIKESKGSKRDDAILSFIKKLEDGER